MNANELDSFKKLLLEKRGKLLDEMGSMKNKERESSIKEEDGDNSSYSNHLADQGTDSITQEQNFMHIQRESSQLYDIDEALEKIESGQYGECEMCKKPIAKQRLEALPDVRLCIECKSKFEESKNSNSDEEILDIPDIEYIETY
ncbi:TraR/DksA family transcriptional regulator [bacterium]|nr:TraR/DksA family transcriptional regulator [bacterium]